MALRSSHRSIRTVALLSSAVAALILLHGATPAFPQSISEVREQVEAINHDAVVAIEEYNVAVDKLKTAEQELRTIDERLAGQQEELAQLQAEMAEFVSLAYRNGTVDETLQLLTTDDPDLFLDQAATLDQLSARQTDALLAVQVARQQLEQTRLAAEQKVAEIDAVREQLKAKKEEIEGKLQRAKALLAQLTAEERAKLQEASEELPASVAASGRAKVAIDFATAQLGEPYLWGGAGPGSWDCSGLTQMAWREAGVSLPHSSAAQYGYGTHVSKSQLQPGDLVFFYSPISHVGIYIGDGKMIHAPQPGDVVKVSSISGRPFAGATRLG